MKHTHPGDVIAPRPGKILVFTGTLRTDHKKATSNSTRRSEGMLLQTPAGRGLFTLCSRCVHTVFTLCVLLSLRRPVYGEHYDSTLMVARLVRYIWW